MTSTLPTPAALAPQDGGAPSPDGGPRPAPGPSGRRRVRAVLRSLRAADWLAGLFVLALLLAVAAPALLTAYDPLDAGAGQILEAPGTAHPLGTDYLGRDLASRLIFGTTTTFSASAVAVSVGLAGGIVLGLVAGYLGGWVDALVSRIVDVLLSVPGLLLSMVIIVALGFGAINAAIAVGISSIANFARITRSEVLRIRNSAFVEAAQHQGSGRTRTLIHHILPNSLGPVLTLIPLQFGGAIIWISALSFLGFGAVPPQPEWGLLVSEGRQYVMSAPWLLIGPGLAIVLTVLSLSHLQRLAARLRKEFS
ncbi:ABC transporter permease [Citricoccus sp.]|uniref:ABC transporter permease n=1 Tax=Citricoccus sp. TaxID=1978372 RepID=UPI0028BDBBA0|nr:ABC transporter permease [Citricoccus sp.]